MEDWMCPNCEVVIFGSKDQCKKCNSTNPKKLKVIKKLHNDWFCYKCKSLQPKPQQIIFEKVGKDLPTFTNEQTYDCHKNYFNETNKIYDDIKKDNLEKRNILIKKAQDEGRPRLYYASDCWKCKRGDTDLHNCWKYS